MNTAEYIIKKLEELGINDFFGVPGDYNFNILYALQKNQNTNWIGCTNELNAGYAADGYARIRGYGAVITTYGVGELSAINAIAGSMAENIPVVCIVGIPSTDKIEEEKLIHHNLADVDYKAFWASYKTVTAASAYLDKDNAKSEIDRVLMTLVKEKKPVYIAVPSDIALMEISDNDILYDWTSNQDNLNEAMQKIADIINNSKNPLIIGDSLIKRFDSLVEYREFVAKTSIPTTNFLMGTNIIDMELPNYIGGYYSSYCNKTAENYVNNADCLIAVGTICSDLNAFGFNHKNQMKDLVIINGTNVYVNNQLYEDIKMPELLESLTESIKPRKIFIEKTDYRYNHEIAETKPLNTKYIYSRIQEFIKENDIIIAETGTITYGMAKMKFPHNVNVEFQSLWSSIGWATPALLGASVAKPQSRTILITGDGAHQMSCMEVGTFLKYNLKPIIFVLNNDGYTIERLLSDDFDNEFNNVVNMSYTKFARIFEGDIWAVKVSTNDEFDKALKVTQIMNKTCYIEMCTDKADVPELAQNIVNILKNNDNKNIDLLSSETHVKYETTVHTAFYENIKTKEEKTTEEVNING